MANPLQLTTHANGLARNRGVLVDADESGDRSQRPGEPLRATSDGDATDGLTLTTQLPKSRTTSTPALDWTENRIYNRRRVFRMRKHRPPTMTSELYDEKHARMSLSAQYHVPRDS